MRTVSDWFTTLIIGRERSPGNIVTEDMVRTLIHEAVGEGKLAQMEVSLPETSYRLIRLTFPGLRR